MNLIVLAVTAAAGGYLLSALSKHAASPPAPAPPILTPLPGAFVPPVPPVAAPAPVPPPPTPPAPPTFKVRDPVIVPAQAIFPVTPLKFVKVTIRQILPGGMLQGVVYQSSLDGKKWDVVDPNLATPPFPANQASPVP